MKFLIFIIGLYLIKCNVASNVLVLSGIPSPSHYIFNKAIAEGLALRGHNVTFLSPDVSKDVVENFHYIHLEEIYAYYYNGSEHIDLLEMTKETPIQSLFSFYDFGAFMCEGIAKSEKGMKSIQDYPSEFQFDLVLHDYTCGPCLLGLLPKFKYPPVIGISAFNNPPYTVDIVGGDKLGLTAKPFYLLKYETDMNVLQRLHNGFFNFLDSMYRKYFAMPAINEQMKKLFGKISPSADDLDKLHSLMFVNSNPAIDFAESLPPNIIQVGGLQIKEAKALPQDINQFIMRGKKGAVVMALGTNIRSDQIGAGAIKCIIEAFRMIPDYSFIWKFETSEMIKELPPNVMIRDWLPQNDILAHPHVKAFITHGGLLSVHEAIWHGIPMVVMPFFSDQHRNSFRIVSAGIALQVNYHTITSEKLKKNVIEVLHSPKYRKNVQLKSKRFRDQPEKPLDRAMWWCEYVMRNPKPTHLKQAEFNFGLLGSHFWDIQVIIIIMTLIAFACLRKIFQLIFFSTEVTVSGEKKNN